MKCPHCQYEHKEEEWDSKTESWTEATWNSPFYASPVVMEKPETDSSYADRKTLYACPECGKAFIEV